MVIVKNWRAGLTLCSVSRPIACVSLCGLTADVYTDHVECVICCARAHMSALNKAWSDRNLVWPTDFFPFYIFFIKKIEGRGWVGYVPAFTQVRVVIMCNVVELNADCQKKIKKCSNNKNDFSCWVLPGQIKLWRCVCFCELSLVVHVEHQIRSVLLFSWVHLLREVEVKKDGVIVG